MEQFVTDYEYLGFNPADLLIQLSGGDLGESEAEEIAHKFVEELKAHDIGKLPEVVTSKARLKELPPHTMILTDSKKPEFDPGDSLVKLTGETKARTWWNQKTRSYLSDDEVQLPVTVVFTPTKFRAGANPQ